MSVQPPHFLGEVARQKWADLTALRGEPKPVELDVFTLACAAWEGYLLCHCDVLAKGPVYTDTGNGRTWNNPNVNNANTYFGQYTKALKILGMLPDGHAMEDKYDDLLKPEGLD